MIDLFGERTSGWIGKTITLVFDPAIQNPMNAADPGGIRIRRPDTQTIDEDDWVSDLDDTSAPALPAKTKGNGAETKARPSRARMRAER